MEKIYLPIQLKFLNKKLVPKNYLLYKSANINKKKLKHKNFYICPKCFFLSDKPFCEKCKTNINNRYVKNENIEIIENNDKKIYIKKTTIKPLGNNIKISNEKYLYDLINNKATLTKTHYILNKQGKPFLLNTEIENVQITKNKFFYKENIILKGKKKHKTQKFDYFISIPPLKEAKLYEFPEILLFFNYLIKNNLFEKYTNSYNLIYYFSLNNNIGILEKILKEKNAFFYKLFGKKFNSETIKILKKYENFLKNDENIETLKNKLKNFNLNKQLENSYANFTINRIFYSFTTKFFYETIRYIDNIDNINKILKYYLILVFKKDKEKQKKLANELGVNLTKIHPIETYLYYSVEKHFKNFMYIYKNLFGYKEKDIINFFIEKNTGMIFNDLSTLEYELKNLNLNRKWKSLFKEYFKEYKKYNPNWKKDKFIQRGENFLTFFLKTLNKYGNDPEVLKKIKIKFKYKNILEIFEKKIKNYDFKILKNKFEFVSTGNAMSNCIGGYFNKINKNNKNNLVIIGYEKGVEKIALEIKYEAKIKNDIIEKIENIKIIQAYQKYNSNLTEEQKKIVIDYIGSILNIPT